jgi:hypothetical protein
MVGWKAWQRETEGDNELGRNGGREHEKILKPFDKTSYTVQALCVG